MRPPPPQPGRTSMLAALEDRDFRLFWFGLVVLNIGSWTQIYGLGWLVVQLAIRDGAANLAPLYLGLVGLSRAIPAWRSAYSAAPSPTAPTAAAS